MPIDIYYIVYGIPVTDEVLETIKKSLINHQPTITEDLVDKDLDEEFQEFNKKLKELNTDGKNLQDLSDKIDDERNLIRDHPALTRKNFRHFSSQYITRLKNIAKLFLERRRTKDLCISQKDLKIKITNIVNLFGADDRKNFFDQLNSLSKDYVNYCQRKREIEKDLDKLGIIELYQGNTYVGTET